MISYILPSKGILSRFLITLGCIILTASIILPSHITEQYTSITNTIDTIAAPQTYNINTSTITGFGGMGEDGIWGSKVLPTKKILIAGLLDQNQNFNAPVTTLNGGGRGFIAQIDNTGQTVEKITRFSQSAGQIELMSNGNIVVASTEGVFVFSADLSTILWSDSFTSQSDREETYPTSIDVAPDNSVAVLYNKSIGTRTYKVYDSSGVEKFTNTIAVSRVEDIAIDNDKVYITGYNQKDGGECSQWQSPYIFAFDHTGSSVWTAYNWSQFDAAENQFGVAQDQTNNCADTRGKLLEVNPITGNLMWVATSDGGNSVIRWDSKELWKPIKNVRQDYSSNPAGGAARTSNIVELDTEGNALMFQVHSSRISNSSGNSITFTSLDFDQDGELLITGQSAFALESRNPDSPGPGSPGLSINGQLIPEYSGFEMFMMQISPNLEKKRYLTTVSGTNCDSTGWTMSSYDGLVFVGGNYKDKNTTDTCQNMLVQNELQTSLVDDIDGFYTVFGDTTVAVDTNCVEWKTLVNGVCEYNTPNIDPTIAITNIQDGDQFLLGQDIDITIQFNDAEDLARRASIIGNFSTLLSRSKPFVDDTLSYTWQNLPLGTHYLYATIRDDHPTVDNPQTPNRGGTSIPTDVLRIEVVESIQNQSSSSSVESSQQSSSESSSIISSSQSSNTQSSSSQESSTSEQSSSSISSSSESSQVSSSVNSSSETSSSDVSSSSEESSQEISSSNSSTQSSLNQTGVDTDPIDAEVENSGPNIGDGNNDGILDSTQNTVTTFRTLNNSFVTTQFNDSCTEIETLAPRDAVLDTLYTYPLDLVEFSAQCSNQAIITTYWHGLDSTNGLALQKYNPIERSFTNLEGSIDITTINGNTVVVTTHTIIDNSENDLDARVGFITDPYGLGLSVNATNSNQNPPMVTVRSGGIQIIMLVAAALLMIGGSILTHESIRS